jgi:surface antigen
VELCNSFISISDPKRILPMRRLNSAFPVIFLAASLSGCTSSSTPVATPVAAPLVGGLMAGPLGQPLSDTDREKGWAAEMAALEGSKRASWRGDKGSFGFVEPGSASGSCRTYIHTIYLDGRPQKASGNACKGADGNWK